MEEKSARTESAPAIGADDLRQIAASVFGGESNIKEVCVLPPHLQGKLYETLGGGRGMGMQTALLALAADTRCASLLESLQAAVERHDSLRSEIVWQGVTQPYQVVLNRVPLPVQMLTLQDAAHHEAELLECAKEQRSLIDLWRAPALRLQIVNRDAGECQYALLHANSLLCDPRSFAAVVGEVRMQMAGRMRQTSLAVEFADSSSAPAGNRTAEHHEGFFRARLGDVSECTAPFGFGRVLESSRREDELQCVLNPDISRRIRAQADELGVGVSALLHAAWAVLVGRASAREDVVFGIETDTGWQAGDASGRRVGSFLNTLPLRLRLRGVTVTQLIMQVANELRELSKHASASISLARHCSGLAAAERLSGAMFRYRAREVPAEADGPTDSPLEVVAWDSSVEYPIEATVTEYREAFTLIVKTDGRLSAHRIANYMQASLSSMLGLLEGNPSTAVSAWTVVPEAELRQLLEVFNATAAAFSAEKLVHELIEQQVEKTPQAIALSHAGRELTYRQLNQRANQLARYLRRQGVGPDRTVGLYFERSVDLVVALLAVLKAGGAYLPLDPAYPAERLSHMIRDAQPPVVLTTDALRHSLPATDAAVVAYDSEAEEVCGYSAENLPASEAGLTSNNLVYVVYTSGSTGVPKGIAMPHRAMVNLLEWHFKGLGGCSGQHTLQFAAISFDVAFQETATTLCSGGTLVLLNEWVRKDHRALAEFLVGQSIQRVFLPPLVLHSVAECFKSSGMLPAELRDVITAGEQLRITPEIVDLFSKLPACRLHNHYGPAETHVVTALTLPADPGSWPTLPAIGRPISNARIYLLDEGQQPAPRGVAGEIYIGGVGMARGYLDRAELTLQRFIEDPFSADPRDRLYRTGDLGRYDDDGTLQYLGRNDHQVKLRGYRIELGEIEARLVLHPRVKEAAVIAREQGSGDKRLIAYVTAAGESSGSSAPTAEELRAYLMSVVPEFMVPSAFVLLDRLPLNPNGKLDRSALPVPGAEAYVAAEYEAPSGEIETTLARMWMESLHLERVGRTDNFFALGGHSVIGTKLIVKIADAFGIKVPFHAMFLHPTVREMAELVTTLQEDQRQMEPADQPEFEEGIV